MHWIGSSMNSLALYKGKPELTHLDFVSQGPHSNLQCMALGAFFFIFFYKPCQAPPATTEVWSRSRALIPAQYQTAAGLKGQGVSAYTHGRRNGGSTQQGQRGSGSGGQVCKPHTPSRETKVTRGMCALLISADPGKT